MHGAPPLVSGSPRAQYSGYGPVERPGETDSVQLSNSKKLQRSVAIEAEGMGLDRLPTVDYLRYLLGVEQTGAVC